MTKKSRKYLKVILRLSVSGLILYFVLSKTDLPSLGDLLKRSNPILLLGACIFFIASKVLSAYRLNLFFGATSIELSPRSNLRLYWLGMFYNLVLPGGIGGDGYKVYFLKKNFQSPVKKAVLSLIFDRVSGLVALTLLCFVFALFIKQSLFNQIYIILVIICLPVLFYFIAYKWFSVFYRTLNRTNLQSLLVQLAQVVCAWLILLAIGGVEKPVDYLFVFLVSSVVAVIPFTIGGAGARELTFLYASEIMHLDLTISITLSLLFFAISSLVSITGAWYSIRPELIEVQTVNKVNAVSSD